MVKRFVAAPGKRAALAAASIVHVALAGCEVTGSQPVGYQSQILLAEQFLQNDEYTRAYEVLDSVEAANRSSSEVQLALGGSYLRGGAFLKAERAFTAARNLGAALEAARGLGRVALARNDANAAMSAFAEVLARNPLDAGALNGTGVAHDLRREHGLAQDFYRQAMRADPAFTESHNNLGLSLILGGDPTEAVRVLSDLTRSELDNPVARQNLAIAYALVGRDEDAIRLATLDVERAEAGRLFRAVSAYRARP